MDQLIEMAEINNLQSGEPSDVNGRAESGAVIAVPPMTIPGHGTCAIYFQGGVQAGLWQI